MGKYRYYCRWCREYKTAFAHHWGEYYCNECGNKIKVVEKGDF